MNRTLSPTGLEAWLESTRIMLPLRGMEIRSEVFSGFARVEIDQIYIQTNKQPMDCRYVFPLPADAAVHLCEMHVNGRVVLARIEERGAAEAIYKKAKEAGHRAALAVGERENLFTLELGNLQPSDVILMRLAYIQPLQRLQDQRSLRVPTSPGVRFIPGNPLLRPNRGKGSEDDTDLVPDASRISPPRIDSGHPDAAVLNVSVRLRGGVETARAVSSPSHILAVRAKGEDLNVSLASDREFPDKDFVMTWYEPAPDELLARTWLDENRRGMLEIRIPSKEEFLPAAADMYFLLDRSGSMQGENWAGACRALAALKSRLDPDTPVWLSVFESGHQDWAEKPIAAGELDFGPDGSQIERIGTAGGTNLKQALEHLAGKVRSHSAGRSAAILILTDGQVGNEDAVVACARKAECPVHVVGIALSPNDALRAVAEETGGRAVFLSPGEDIPAAVERFTPLLRTPVIRGISMPEGWKAADGRQLRDLTAGDNLLIPISASPRAAGLLLTGTSGGGASWECTPEPRECKPAGLVWARARIRHLERGEDPAALALAKEFNLLCKTAAFVAWDEAEKVVIAKKQIEQPALKARKLPVLASPAAVCSVAAIKPSFRQPRTLESPGMDTFYLRFAARPADVTSEGFLTPVELLVRLEGQAGRLLAEICGLENIPSGLSENLSRLRRLAGGSRRDFAAQADPLLAGLIALLKELVKKHPESKEKIKELVALAKKCRKRVSASAAAAG